MFFASSSFLKQLFRVKIKNKKGSRTVENQIYKTHKKYKSTQNNCQHWVSTTYTKTYRCSQKFRCLQQKQLFKSFFYCVSSAYPLKPVIFFAACSNRSSYINYTLQRALCNNMLYLHASCCKVMLNVPWNKTINTNVLCVCVLFLLR